MRLSRYATPEPFYSPYVWTSSFLRLFLGGSLRQSMRFPTKESRAAEDAEKLREREKELVKEIEDGDLDDDDDVGPDFGV